MRPMSRRWDWRAVFAAAILLVFQSSLSAFAIGAASGPMPLDAFGNPLCITSSDISPQDGESGQPPALHECCTLGCAAGQSLATPQEHADAIGIERTSASILPVALAQDRVQPDDYHPGNPRAPPAVR